MLIARIESVLKSSNLNSSNELCVLNFLSSLRFKALGVLCLPIKQLTVWNKDIWKFMNVCKGQKEGNSKDFS